MPETDGSTKPPQISEMFQKFALAFKTKTFEFFAEEEETAANAAATDSEDADGFALLDSAEEFITDQKVVVIKPDRPYNRTATSTKPANNLYLETLMSSLFATISSFEASYLQLQTAHVPFNEDAIKTADRGLVSHLQRMSDLKKSYRNFMKSPNSCPDYSFGSCLEAKVEENQSKLRMLETIVNRLQSDIDIKDDEVLALRKQLGHVQTANSKLTKRLSTYQNAKVNSGIQVSLTIRVFDSVLRDAYRALHSFTRLLIELMKKAGWDLKLAANTVHPNIDYDRNGHYRYAFLSYLSLGMFRGFDSESFGLGGSQAICNGSSEKTDPLKQLIEHISGNPMEVLSKSPSCEFSKFCERKYQQLIHPTMESSIFSDLDRKEAVLSSWRSLSAFYESFVNMGSSIWLLHKLAYSFNPAIEIFQVDSGIDFSMVYMEDVTGKARVSSKSRPRVGFTVVPGFKVGKTVIQAQVYLTGLSVYAEEM